MRLKDFKKLSLSRQIDEIISFGKQIDTFVTGESKVISYQMEGFVVDIYYELQTNSFQRLYYGS